MNKYDTFRFIDYRFRQDQRTAYFTYGYDKDIQFTESYTFDFKFVDYDDEALDRALQHLFFMAGVSYYKCFLAPEIVIEKGTISPQLADFLSNTYQKGLGEFFYVNQLDPTTPVTFPVTNHKDSPIFFTSNGSMVGIGGGKDSLVSVELLKRTGTRLTTWSLGHKEQLTPLVEVIGLEHLFVSRKWDTQLLSLNDEGAYNGHVPISAILACAGTVTAILSGNRDVVVSNEYSSNEETLQYKGVSINHQYSKSSNFEVSYQALLQASFGDSVRYYSLLRPYSELKICEFFAPYYDKYKSVFSSCNKAFTHKSQGMFWCGDCPKCAFVYLALSPFVERSALNDLIGYDLLSDQKNDTLYRELLGITGEKPLECVGEIKESRSAMRLASANDRSLDTRFKFTIPEDYDWKSQKPDLIPSDVRDILLR